MTTRPGRSPRFTPPEPAPEDFRLQSYQYDLPAAAIARHPLPERDASRLMVLCPGRPPDHRRFADLPDLLPEDAHLVFNDTRVLPARLRTRLRGGRPGELLLCEPAGIGEWWCLVRPGAKYPVGREVDLEPDGPAGVVLAINREGMRRIRFEDAPALDAWMARHGEIPLPPYLERRAEPSDTERYQTVYADRDGSVAAPTAGLHFTPALLGRLAERGIRSSRVTLHVGPGTFRPVQTEDIRDHRMHAERWEILQEAADAIAGSVRAGRPVIPVGTTALRTLESAWDGERFPAASGDTSLFLYPGQPVRVARGLITNFHLPASSLLMLVSALWGRREILAAYREALAGGYRFFSYGDAMLLLP